MKMSNEDRATSVGWKQNKLQQVVSTYQILNTYDIESSEVRQKRGLQPTI